MSIRLLRRARAAHRRSAVGSVLTALALVMTIAACDGSPPPPENAPYWHPGTVVTATHHGPLVRIQWSATTGGDPVNGYQINLGTYNGTVVALVPASVRDCYITGLAASTPYTIVVTARDAQQHWSGPLPGTQGNRTTTITTTGHGGSGNLWCHAATDTDSDGVPNALETNDGTYTSASDVGTDPANPDTDNDGITDGDEALGLSGLDLRAMGAKATHKDILTEIDWLGSTACPAGSRPTATSIAFLADAFAAAPVTNPDGTTGIKVIADYGQSSLFNGGNLIADDDGDPNGYVETAAFKALKAAHFAPARENIFHYAIVGTSGGNNAEGGGDDLFVSNSCNHDAWGFAGMFMHEIGHNFRLGHAGRTYRFPSYFNHFPNYNSVMNYLYSGPGVDTDCDGQGNNEVKLDYSQGLLPPLDETDLDERVGVCGELSDPDIDWNGNGTIESSVAFDANGDGAVNVYNPFDDETTPLLDHDDWTVVEEDGLICISDPGVYCQDNRD
ncbi:MAG TPA: hypothetical protein VEW93_07615 [Acidimicrobiales bacterium]|nr:hypothetical protein [Acidimicrobiales bacterium]